RSQPHVESMWMQTASCTTGSSQCSGESRARGRSSERREHRVAATKPSPIGRQIRKYREEMGLSLGELAEKTGLSKSYLWSLENESTARRPSGNTLYEIAKTLGVTMSDLLERELLSAPSVAIP